VRDIVNNVIERFPFEGTVIGNGRRSLSHQHRKNWRIGPRHRVHPATPTFGEGGKVSGYRETGRIEVKRGDDNSALAEVATLKQGEKVQIGDRVVRRTGATATKASDALTSCSPRRAASARTSTHLPAPTST